MKKECKHEWILFKQESNVEFGYNYKGNLLGYMPYTKVPKEGKIITKYYICLKCSKIRKEIN